MNATAPTSPKKEKRKRSTSKEEGGKKSKKNVEVPTPVTGETTTTVGTDGVASGAIEKKKRKNKKKDICSKCSAPKNWAELLANTKKRRTKADGPQKKNAPTAYILFSSEHFKEHREQLFKQEQNKSPEVQDIKSIKCTDVGKYSGSVWKSMTDDLKQPYKDRVAEIKKNLALEDQGAPIVG